MFLRLSADCVCFFAKCIRQRCSCTCVPHERASTQRRRQGNGGQRTEDRGQWTEEPASLRAGKAIDTQNPPLVHITLDTLHIVST